MSNIIQIAYTTEGNTDERFLGHIIEKTFESLLFESIQDIEIHPPIHISEKAETFNEKIKAIATKYNYFHVICVHCDADAPSKDLVLNRKIIPAFQLVERVENACKNLIAIIPVQMTEAWMLADIDLLLNEINTNKSCTELNLPCKHRQVEAITDPKSRIEEALRIAQVNLARRRKKLKITDLYTPISQKLKIEQLEKLESFKTFKENVRNSLIKLNYLQQ